MCLAVANYTKISDCAELQFSRARVACRKVSGKLLAIKRIEAMKASGGGGTIFAALK